MNNLNKKRHKNIDARWTKKNIAKQSYKGIVYTYLGIILGFITVGILFPRFLKPEQIGLISILLSYATIFGQAANMGFPVVIIVWPSLI